MADVIPTEIPSKGYLFHYTTSETHTADGPNATAVPNSGGTAMPAYPISANNPTWIRLRAISEPTGMGNFSVETTAYRNGDPESPVVEDFHTGFMSLGQCSIKLAWDRDVYEDLRDLAAARTKIRFIFTYPLRPGETTASRLAARAFIISANEMFDAGGAPIMLDLVMSKCDDIPQFFAGSTSPPPP